MSAAGVRDQDGCFGAGHSGGPRPSVAPALALVIVCSTVLDLFFFTGFYATDDQQYFRGALGLLAGRFRDGSPTHGEMRLLLTGWNALVVVLCGVRVQWLAASYVVWHQVLNLSSFLLGRQVLDTRAGLLAAYLTATMPLLVVHATMILPDIPLAAFVMLAFLAFHEACRRRTPQQTRQSACLMFLAGVCSGLAYSAKESGLLLLPFFFLWWLVAERRLAGARHGAARLRTSIWHGACFALGVAGVVLDETAILTLLTGGFRARLAWTPGQFSAGRMERIRQAGIDPLARLSRFQDVLQNEHLLPGAILAFVAFGVLAYPLLRRRCWPLYLLPVWIFAYQTWGSMSLVRYAPPLIKSRYYIPVVALATVVSAAAACQVWTVVTARIAFGFVRRPLSAAAFAAVALAPLLWLGGPNELAGKSSRAELVGVATAAINQALAEDGLPVVLSGSVARIIAPLLQEPSNERLIRADDVTPETLEDLASRGGFKYVELNEAYVVNRRNRFVAASALDCLMHALLHERTAALAEGFPWKSPVLGLSLESGYLSHFDLDHRRYFLAERATLRSSGDRLGHLRRALLGEICEPDIPDAASSASVYRVIPQSLAETATQGAPGGSEFIIDLTDRLGRWRVYHTQDCEVIRKRGKPPLVVSRMSPDDYAWYTLPASDRQLPCRFAPGLRWQLGTRVMLEGDVRLELVMRCFADPQFQQFVAQRRVQMQSGTNRFGIWTPTRPLFIRPAFRVTGAGRFSVESLVFNGEP